MYARPRFSCLRENPVRRCSQEFHPGDGAPYRGGYSGNLVLHLDKSSVQLRELSAMISAIFRRRSDGISSEKNGNRGERTVSDCLVSRQKATSGIFSSSFSFTVIAISGQMFSHCLQPMQSS